jgi:hypothetical protein
MKLVSDRTITNDTVVLDDTNFTNCKFLNCKIQYGGGAFVFNNSETSNCSFDFVDAAFRMIQLLRQFGFLESQAGGGLVIPAIRRAAHP